MNTHIQEAERLMAESKRLKRRAKNPDAAGPIIRARWDKEADELMAEAQVHATLATLEVRAAIRAGAQ